MHVVQTENRLHPASAVCIKWTNAAGDKQVSVAANDSCGTMNVMGRCDIRCYAEFPCPKDVTEVVFGTTDTIRASNADLRKALDWLGD